MRKYLPVMLSMALTMPLVACGDNGQEEDNTPQSNRPSKPGNDNNNNNKPGNDNQETSNSVIAKINRGEIKKDAEVVVEEAVITAISNKLESNNPVGIQGIYISEIITQAKAYTGIYVYIKDVADVDAYKVGNTVKITGTVSEYSGQVQISASNIQVIGNGTVPAPVVITDLASIATKYEKAADGDYYIPGTTGADAKKYHGVLVKVENVTSTNDSIAEKKSNCEVTETNSCMSGKGFEVNDALVIGNTLYYTPKALRNVGTQFDYITGIVATNYGSTLLFPRTADDVKKTGSSGNNDNPGQGTTEREYTATAIADIQSGDIAADTYVSVTGTVISHTSAPYDNSLSFYIVDENADAIEIYSASYNADDVIEKGVNVTVTGKVTFMSSNDGAKYTMVEVTGAGKPAIKVNGQGQIPTPKTITLPVDESSRGQYVTIENLTIKEAADGYCFDSNAEKVNYCSPTLADEKDNTVAVKYLKIDKNDKVYGSLKELIGNNFSTDTNEFNSVSGILDVNYGNLVLYVLDQDDIDVKVVE